MTEIEENEVARSYVDGRHSGGHRSGASSGSFTTALLKALHAHQRNLIHPQELAEQACDIEINRLGEPIGKHGTGTSPRLAASPVLVAPDGKVRAWPLRVSEEMRYNLEDNLLLFFTGYSRSASTVLKEQNDRSKTMDPEMFPTNLHFCQGTCNAEPASA